MNSHNPATHNSVLFVVSLCLFASPARGEVGMQNDHFNEVDFQTQVRPLLSQYCFTCHGPDAQTREADLRLDIASEAARVLSDGSAAETDQTDSELGSRIRTTDPDLIMPPPSSPKQPSAAERQLLLSWLKSGGEMTQHWSFRTPTRPPIPHVGSDGERVGDWVRNPIDAFVLARMLQQGLSPSPRATASALRRRIAMALTGLPEIDGVFKTADKYRSADRYADQLINSPAYGEHMAFGWLEAARYADTDGYQNDRYRYQSAWRDWVIRAFDSHMPYDQFVIEQLAGDMLPDATLWQQVATGFGRNHRINSEDGSIEAEWRVENVVDRVDTLGTVFLGLTIGCARCHDHKYDPISQTEYYELFAYFNSIAEYGVGPNNGNTPPFVQLPESWPWISEAEDRALTPDPVKLSAARKEAGNGLRRPQPGQPGTVMVLHELSDPRKTFRLDRGQYDAPDKTTELSPGVPSALSFNEQAAPKSRLELARWLVHPNNPLTARVAVNRIWQQMFGRGLVETSENFGSQGNPPSHPQLLDWLACELVDSGWNLQHIQRLIINSATFQQSASVTTDAASVDLDNRWLARGPRVRFSAAEVRDMALTTSGLLVHRFGGESVKPYMPPKIWSAMSNNKYKQDSGEKLFRRSLYTYWRRTIPPPTMVNFNAANRELCSVRNTVTNTPLQALTLLNNKTFVEAARNLAQLAHASSELPTEQIDFAARRVLGRPLSNNEIQVLRDQYDVSLEEFDRSPEQVSQLLAVGESPSTSSSAEVAALSVVASILYNTDEAISR